MKEKILILALLLLIPAAFSGEFTAYSRSSEISVCACSIYENPITVRNTGTGIHDYSVSQSGNAAAWSALAPAQFPLSPGDSQRIEDFINVPCRTEGDFELSTRFRDNLGNEKELVQEFNVKRCDNVKITPVLASTESCPCTPKVLEARIRNTGSFTDTYDISIEGAEDLDFTANEKTFIIQPGKEADLYVYVQGKCEVYGTFTPKLKVSSRNNHDEDTIDLSIDIRPCYDYEVGFADAKISKEDNFSAHRGGYNLCEGINYTIPFMIRNTANITNDYNLYLSAPGWARLNDESIHNLSKGSAIVSYIYLFPDQYLKGEFDLELMIVSDKGGIVKRYPITIDLGWCRTAEISSPEKVSLNYSDTFVPFSITNMGMLNMTYALNLEGPGWAMITREIPNEAANGTEKEGTRLVKEIEDIAIASGETANLLLRLSPDNNSKEGTYTINLSAYAAGEREPYTQRIEVKLRKDRNLQPAIYLLLILILLALLIFLIAWLKGKTGKEKGHKEEKTGAVSTKRDEKTEAEEHFKKEKLQPLSTKRYRKRKKRNYWWILWLLLIILLMFALGYLGWKYYPEVKVIGGGENNGSALHPEQGLIQNSTESPDETGADQLEDKENTTNRTPEETGDSTIGSDSNAGAAEEGEKAPDFESINCTFTSYRDEILVINLSQYFFDPDGDRLFFDYTIVPSHFDVNQSEGLFMLKPEEGFTGIDYIEFTADDKHGGLIESGRLTLCVRERESERTWSFAWLKEFIYSYIYYILAGIILLVIIIAIMIVKEDKPDRVEDPILIHPAKTLRKSRTTKKKAKKKKKKTAATRKKKKNRSMKRST